MDKIIILDELPEYYLNVKGFILVFKFYTDFKPDVVAICKEKQLYILRSDIPIINTQHLTYEEIFADICFKQTMNDEIMETIANHIPFNLFIKFGSQSDQIKWKLSNG